MTIQKLSSADIMLPTPRQLEALQKDYRTALINKSQAKTTTPFAIPQNIAALNRAASGKLAALQMLIRPNVAYGSKAVIQTEVIAGSDASKVWSV